MDTDNQTTPLNEPNETGIVEFLANLTLEQRRAMGVRLKDDPPLPTSKDDTSK